MTKKFICGKNTRKTQSIILSGNHDFKRSVIDTIIEENINPVSSLLHSNTIIASTIFGVQNPATLLNNQNPEE